MSRAHSVFIFKAASSLKNQNTKSIKEEERSSGLSSNLMSLKTLSSTNDQGSMYSVNEVNISSFAFV